MGGSAWLESLPQALGQASARAARIRETRREGAPEDERLQLGRLELEQLLRRGHLERGLELTHLEGMERLQATFARPKS